MRGILFRGKRKDNGEWIEGYYAHPTYYLDDRDFHIIFPLNFVAYPRCEFSDYEEVIPKTVGRFTGLNEKNENGKKIFEEILFVYLLQKIQNTASIRIMNIGLCISIKNILLGV